MKGLKDRVAISSWHAGEILEESCDNHHSRFCSVFQKAIVYEKSISPIL